jgi:broad specificity phosphatase PhoE
VELLAACCWLLSCVVPPCPLLAGCCDHARPLPSSPSWALRMDGWRSAATMEQFLSAASNVAISVSSHLDLAGARWGQRAVPLAVLGLVGVSSACCWLHCCRDMGDDCCRAFASDCQRRTEELARRPLRRSVRVLLIRHAQSETNAAAANTVVGGARHDGRGVHTRLSKLGERQARALGARLARQNLRPQAIYASDAVRTQQTAELVRAELLRGGGAGGGGVATGGAGEMCGGTWAPPPVEVVASALPSQARGIGEVCMGSWSGRTKRECESEAVTRAREHDAYEWAPPGTSVDEGLRGESYRNVEERE